MTARQGLSRLLSRLSDTSSLADLPEKLERIFAAYDGRAGIHPAFRNDIYDLLQTSTDLSLHLSSATYDARVATQLAVRLQGTLANLLIHLSDRPQASGFSILFPGPVQLHEGFFSTEAEAEGHLAKLRSLGTSPGQVVPVNIVSCVTTQPKGAPRPNAAPIEDLEDPILEAKIAQAKGASFE